MRNKKRTLRIVLLLRNTLAVIAVVLAIAVAVLGCRLLFASNSQDSNQTTVTTEEQGGQGTTSGTSASPGDTAEETDSDKSQLPQDKDPQEHFPLQPDGVAEAPPSESTSPFLPDGSMLPDSGDTPEDSQGEGSSAYPSVEEPDLPSSEGGQIL